MKKFYSSATITPSEQGWILHLDGKLVKTPEKAVLTISEHHLAEEIRREWECQDETIIPHTMPMTQMMMTVIDHITPNRDKLQNEILNYIDTDLICYFTDDPEIYATAQKDSWTPFLEWIEGSFGMPPITTNGLLPLFQPKALHQSINDHVRKLDDPSFGCLYQITTMTGSIFLGLAFVESSFSNKEIYNAALVEDLIKDKIYLADTYGLSPDQEKKRKILEEELENCRKLLNLRDQT